VSSGENMQASRGKKKEEAGKRKKKEEAGREIVNKEAKDPSIM
jgi:hypothetical protein